MVSQPKLVAPGARVRESLRSRRSAEDGPVIRGQARVGVVETEVIVAYRHRPVRGDCDGRNEGRPVSDWGGRGGLVNRHWVRPGPTAVGGLGEGDAVVLA